MPYIKGTDRIELDKYLDPLIQELNRNPLNDPGHLNYCIYRLVLYFFKRDRRYTTIATVTGVLQNVISEFYRVHAVKYEQEKIQENGDITI